MWRSKAKGWEGAGATAPGPWLIIRLRDGASAGGGLLLEAELCEMLETERGGVQSRPGQVRGVKRQSGGSVHLSLLLRNPRGSVQGRGGVGGVSTLQGAAQDMDKHGVWLQKPARGEGRGRGRPVPSAGVHTRDGHSLLPPWGAWVGGRGSP